MRARARALRTRRASAVASDDFVWWIRVGVRVRADAGRRRRSSVLRGARARRAGDSLALGRERATTLGASARDAGRDRARRASCTRAARETYRDRRDGRERPRAWPCTRAWIEQRAGDAEAWERRPARRASPSSRRWATAPSTRRSPLRLAQCLYAQGRFDEARELCVGRTRGDARETTSSTSSTSDCRRRLPARARRVASTRPSALARASARARRRRRTSSSHARSRACIARRGARARRRARRGAASSRPRRSRSTRRRATSPGAARAARAPRRARHRGRVIAVGGRC